MSLAESTFTVVLPSDQRPPTLKTPNSSRKVLSPHNIFVIDLQVQSCDPKAWICSCRIQILSASFNSSVVNPVPVLLELAGRVVLCRKRRHQAATRINLSKLEYPPGLMTVAASCGGETVTNAATTFLFQHLQALNPFLPFGLRPGFGWTSQPGRALSPLQGSRQILHTAPSTRKVHQIIFSEAVTPPLRRSESMNFANPIRNKWFPPIRVSIDPSQCHLAVTPAMASLHVQCQLFSHVTDQPGTKKSSHQL
ncbi:hypothetical protein T11_14440 [Trichinella zimbabwensis]|uniref:Uncharacterized protein n=1 Tax=Trichinella zimbabwensis TaxID=268475 RepID=A0A0V1HDK1_9BILA|nr:hypothetical protein T11_14440 [Trichinella zimbabwensis]